MSSSTRVCSGRPKRYFRNPGRVLSSFAPYQKEPVSRESASLRPFYNILLGCPLPTPVKSMFSGSTSLTQIFLRIIELLQYSLKFGRKPWGSTNERRVVSMVFRYFQNLSFLYGYRSVVAHRSKKSVLLFCFKQSIINYLINYSFIIVLISKTKIVCFRSSQQLLRFLNTFLLGSLLPRGSNVCDINPLCEVSAGTKSKGSIRR